MTDKLPWFPFFVDDWIADCADLTAEQEGCFIRLLTYQWRDGSIPFDLEILARRCRVPQKGFEKRAWPKLEPLFPPVDRGQLANPRLEALRTVRDRRNRKRRRDAKRAAQMRWAREKLLKELDASRMPDAYDSHAEPEPEKNKDLDLNTVPDMADARAIDFQSQVREIARHKRV